MLSSVQVKGQSDTLVYDTVTTIIEEGTEEYQSSYEETTTDRQYFLNKEQTLDSFRVLQRKMPDSIVKEMQADDAFWYANSNIEKKKPKEEEESYVPLGQRKWVQTLLWLVIIGGFATALMWYLAGSNIGLFRKRNIAGSADAEMDEIPENIFAINYQKEIDKAAALGNYRLAIRLMFLRTLKEMSEKNIIQYKQDRTNFDYLLQLQPTGYYNNFFRITRNYEYSWYGQFQVSEEAYKIIRSDFDQFDRQLR